MCGKAIFTPSSVYQSRRGTNGGRPVDHTMEGRTPVVTDRRHAGRIKDIIETADMPTEQGSPLFKGWRSVRDSAGVAALREAGAVVLGKTVTTEFAAVAPGPTRNPWDTSRTPGGSSSGSAAAVAAGIVSAALGTQVIGSIIRPASFCGCFGYKPSIGSINRGGSFDYLSQSSAGVLAATLPELWIVAREISARVGGDPGFPGLSGPREAPAARQPEIARRSSNCRFLFAPPGSGKRFRRIYAKAGEERHCAIHARQYTGRQ